MNIASNYASERVFTARDTSGPWDADVKGRVSVFRLNKAEPELSFDVRYDSGGRRMSLGLGDQICFVGCYHVQGIAAYSASDGTELWRRRDLKQVQHVKTLMRDGAVFCGRDSSSQILAPATGETLVRLRGVKTLYSSPFGPEILLGARQLELHSPYGACRAKIPRKTFADMACGFSPTALALAECSGPLRCFDLANGSLLWQHQPAERSHFLGLVYAEEGNRFIGWLRHIDLKIPDQLVHFEPATGAVQNVVSLSGAVECAFCQRGTAVFTDALTLISTTTGGVIKQFKENE